MKKSELRKIIKEEMGRLQPPKPDKMIIDSAKEFDSELGMYAMGEDPSNWKHNEAQILHTAIEAFINKFSNINEDVYYGPEWDSYLGKNKPNEESRLELYMEEWIKEYELEGWGYYIKYNGTQVEVMSSELHKADTRKKKSMTPEKQKEHNRFMRSEWTETGKDLATDLEREGFGEWTVSSAGTTIVTLSKEENK